MNQFWNLAKDTARVGGNFQAVMQASQMAAQYKVDKNLPSDQRAKELVKGFITNQVAHHPNFLIGVARGQVFGLLMSLPELGFMAATSVKNGLQNRTSMVIPFSHTTVNMQLAKASFGYAQQRASNAYGSLDSTAFTFAQRYMNR